MNLTRDECVALASGLAKFIGATSDVEVAVCPPSPYLDAVHTAIEGSAIQLGAQNMYHEPEGAFTGEISGKMLKDIGCKYVILGHSERRHILGESDADVNKKVLAAFETGLIPIVCVGETLEERETGRTQDVVKTQFECSLAGLSNEQASKIVIAYEPVWAIGTGKVATSQQAEDVHADLRKLLESRYNSEVASLVRIQYGGSVKPDNAAELLANNNIDGALVGGASLKVDSFLGIINATT